MITNERRTWGGRVNEKSLFPTAANEALATLIQYLGWGYQPRLNRYSADGGPITLIKDHARRTSVVVVYLADAVDLDVAQAAVFAAVSANANC